MLPRLAFGTQGWAYADWVGPMYDAGTRAGGYLRAYAREFGSVEVDSTFYGTPPPQRLMKWAAATSPTFTFALKVPRAITHDARLIGCAAAFDEFFAAARVLGERLDAVLLQLPPDFTAAEFGALRVVIPALPADVRIALEVRDPSWFEPAVFEPLHALLTERGVALAVSDGTFVSLDLMIAAFARPTAPFGYIRWLGRRDAVDRYAEVVIDRSDRVARWAAAIKAAAPRMQRVSGYVNNHYAGHSPATVRALYAALGVAHTRPERIEQATLF